MANWGTEMEGGKGWGMKGEGERRRKKKGQTDERCSFKRGSSLAHVYRVLTRP